MKKIGDFGSKIGGAKKDLWELFHSLSAEEQGEMAVKTKLWPRPRYEALADKGIPKNVLFWRNQMRKAVKARPQSNPEAYVGFVADFRADVERCESIQDVKDFYAGNPNLDDSNGIFSYLEKYSDDSNDARWQFANNETRNFFSGNAVLRYVYRTEKKINKDLESSTFMCNKEEKEEKKYSVVIIEPSNLTSSKTEDGRYVNKFKTDTIRGKKTDTKNWSSLIEEAEDDVLYLVLYDNYMLDACVSKSEAQDVINSHKEKAAKNIKKRKSALLPPHLSHIERTGSNYDYFRLVDGNALLARYGLRGGEFGNYTTSKDRLGSINMAYDAFDDLYHALGITPEDISLGKNLAIAFGARGRGNAMAHYEPLKNVINITKIRGAGSLAHEWAHAFDMYVGNHYNLHGFMSNNVESSDSVPESAKKLIESFKFQNGKETDFYDASKKFDKAYSQTGNGYWSSTHEMFARAFACYVKDKITAEDRVSDYLVGHAECASDGIHRAYPVGDERKEINNNFDAFIKDIIEEKILTELQEISSDESSNDDNENKNSTSSESNEILVYEGSDGQLLLFC